MGVEHLGAFAVAGDQRFVVADLDDLTTIHEAGDIAQFATQTRVWGTEILVHLIGSREVRRCYAERNRRTIEIDAEGVIDETPGAYKNIDAVMAAQTSPVDVVHTLRQVVCVKG